MVRCTGDGWVPFDGYVDLNGWADQDDGGARLLVLAEDIVALQLGPPVKQRTVRGLEEVTGTLLHLRHGGTLLACEPVGPMQEKINFARGIAR
jgi:hypothetical protein